MGRRGPQRVQETVKVSANIPTWKREILDTLGIHPTYAVNTGIDLVLEQTIQSGRISQDGIAVYIKTLENQAAEIDRKIEQARAILQNKAISQAPGQIRVWDKIEQESRIIAASRFDPAQHILKEVIA